MKLRHINTTDIVDAIRLGCQTMQSVFNRDDRDIPFFASQVRPQTYLGFSSGGSEGHVPGRHLNALLSAEDIADIEIDEQAIEKHASAAFFSFSGSLPLPLDRETIDGTLCHFFPHNLREGMHALYALVRYRDSQQARELAERMINAIFRYWDPVHRWDAQQLQDNFGIDINDGTFITREGRVIGPLVKYYRATGYGPALELALAMKEKAIGEFFREDGSYDPQTFGNHTHSTTCVMSSLAQLADLMHDASLLDLVRSFYDHGLWKIRDELGWVIENANASDAMSDRGEGNNTGDILETALILGQWGYSEYFHDAERILRCHLLPSQLRDNAFIQNPPNPDNEDGMRNVAERHLGAFGFPAPYGHWPLGFERVSFNMDIVGGVVGSLCEALKQSVASTPTGHRVNLLFDRETEAVDVESPYTHDHLRITVKKPGPLWVRIPPWLGTQFKVNSEKNTLPSTSGYLYIAEPPLCAPMTVEFDLPLSELVLQHRLRDIRARLQGDQVVAMDHFGADLTYFDAFD